MTAMSVGGQLNDTCFTLRCFWQEVKTRLAYVTRRKLHKAKREQQKKLQALEARRQVRLQKLPVHLQQKLFLP